MEALTEMLGLIRANQELQEFRIGTRLNKSSAVNSIFWRAKEWN